jgi:hypothetical protein
VLTEQHFRELLCFLSPQVCGHLTGALAGQGFPSIQFEEANWLLAGP